jgi:hypothetical protein
MDGSNHDCNWISKELMVRNLTLREALNSTQLVLNSKARELEQNELNHYDCSKQN